MRVVAVLFALAACSSADEEQLGSGYGQCAERGGTYVVTYTHRSGNCGAPAEEISSGDQPPAGPVDGCEGPGISYTPDNCEVTVDTTCERPDGGRERVNGHAKWSTDAHRGESVIQVVIWRPDGSLSCQGTFNASLRRP